MSLSIYKKKLDYSYTYGIYPTLDLLQKRPEVVRTVLVHPKIENTQAYREILDLCQKRRIRVDEGSKIINRLSVKENTYAIGVFSKYKSQLERDKNHVLLFNPMNTGNVGTIIRSMAGFDVVNLGFIRPCVDIFDPLIVRAAMGAMFDLNFEYFDSFDEYKGRYGKNVVYPFVLNGKKTLNQVTFNEPATLLFGNEGDGLPKFFEKHDTSIRIEHTSKIDSLNLSMAVGIALFKLYNKKI